MFLFLSFCMPISGSAQEKSVAANPKPDQRPNVILIMADDMGYGGVSFTGGIGLRTPHLDRLAREGVSCTNFHTNAPVSSATRCSIMTGMYQQRTGLDHIYSESHPEDGLDTCVVTLAEHLQHNGYHTGMFGKWHLGEDQKFNPTHQGFDEFVGFMKGNIDFVSHYSTSQKLDWWHGTELSAEKGYATDLINKHAVEFIRKSGQKPFFLYVPHAAIHVPMQAPGDSAIRDIRKYAYRNDIKISAEEYLRRYRGMISSMDDGVGMILDELEKTGKIDNTIIIFLSDNGGEKVSLSKYPEANGIYRGWKSTLYEGGIRVPAVFYWKGHLRPAVNDAMMMSMDLFPTILNWCGVPYQKDEIDGIALNASLEKGKKLHPRNLFWANKGLSAMVSDGWKLVWNKDSAELYYLEEDPSEENDLSATYPGKVKKMKSAILSWWKEVTKNTRLEGYSITDLEVPLMKQLDEKTGKKEKVSWMNPELSSGKRAALLLQEMTLEEKIYQLCSGFMKMTAEGSYAPLTKENLEKGIGALQFIHSPRGAEADLKVINDAQKYMLTHTRLGIPMLVHGEALHGHVSMGAASFPQAIALASTWDRELVERVFDYVAAEARSRGTNYVFSPVLDLARDPRWGRMEETYGEDPYLVSEMGLACVRGFQGRGERIDDQHVVASPKHFAGYGQCDGGRNFAPSNITDQVFLEEVLAPFRKVIKEGHIRGVMASHSEWNGVPAHGNHYLLTEILRNQLGFDGIVVSDYHDVERLNILHHIVANNQDAALEAVKAGVNFDLPVGRCYHTLAKGLKKCPDYKEYVDQRVFEILKLKFDLGLFEHPYCSHKEFQKTEACRKALTTEAAAKAVTLLKNEEHLLPLDKKSVRRIALIGPNADQVILGGYSPRKYTAVSIRQGMEEYLKGTGVEVVYAKGCDITRQKSSSQFEVGTIRPAKVETFTLEEELTDIREAVKVAASSDVVVLCLGDNYFTTREAIYNEGNLGDRSELDLVGNQNYLAEQIIACGKPVVVVMMHGRSLTINYLAEHADAILDAWYLGENTGHVIAQTIFGDINPGGKLPVTYPRKSSQLPVYYNQKSAGFLKSYLFEDNSPLWPFGYGLSYTDFTISDIRLDRDCIKAGETCTVSALVTNTGKRAGDEVVQVYVRDEVASVTRPHIQLKEFERVHLLPGESKRVSFVLGQEAFQLLDRNMSFVVEPGDFTIYVSNSSSVKSEEAVQLKIQ